MASRDDEVQGLHRERAEALHDGVPYVRGWAEAYSASQKLADELRALAFEEDFAFLKADVNDRGEGVVNLDLIPADAAQRLGRLLALGLCAELERLPLAEEIDGSPSRPLR
jgi:hypothetical protein